MKIIKSARHSRIAGDFGENLVLYLLSKHGYECATLDHVGIDLIARRPRSGEVMGISLKTRTRFPGTESSALNIPLDNLTKASRACKSFGLKPYFAVVVDGVQNIRVLLMPMTSLKRHSAKGKSVLRWQMGRKDLEKYSRDKSIQHFVLVHETKAK